MVPNGDSIILLISQKGNALHERVDHMLDVGKILQIPPSQDIIIVFFFLEIQFWPYSKILNNISIKTNYVAGLSVDLINLLPNFIVVDLYESL